MTDVKEISCGCASWYQDLNTGMIYVLLVKQHANKDFWGIPKGRKFSNESETHCAIRETFEETGVSCIISEKIFECMNNHGKRVLAFLAKPAYNYNINLFNKNNEVADANWFNVNSIPEIQTYQIEMIKFVIDRIKIEAYKEQRQRIFSRIQRNFVSSFDKNEISTWKDLKENLLMYMHQSDKILFSDLSTEYNELEIELILLWNQMTGKKINCDLKHI